MTLAFNEDRKTSLPSLSTNRASPQTRRLFGRFSPPSLAAIQICFAFEMSTSIVVRPERITPLRKIAFALLGTLLAAASVALAMGAETAGTWLFAVFLAALVTFSFFFGP
jgi:hypothetical protein